MTDPSLSETLESAPSSRLLRRCAYNGAKGEPTSICRLTSTVRICQVTINAIATTATTASGAAIHNHHGNIEGGRYRRRSGRAMR